MGKFLSKETPANGEETVGLTEDIDLQDHAESEPKSQSIDAELEPDSKDVENSSNLQTSFNILNLIQGNWSFDIYIFICMFISYTVPFLCIPIRILICYILAILLYKYW